MRRSIMTVWMVLLVGCTPSLDQNNLNLAGAEDKKVSRVPVASQEMRNISKYYGTNKSFQVEYFTCVPKGARRATVLLVNQDSKAFAKGVCAEWLAQSFLTENYGVLAVNRPGFGATQPPRQDFGGSASVAAIVASANSFDDTKTHPVQGVWASGIGVIAATSAAKKMRRPAWMILGNGIYDMEDFAVHTKSPVYKKWLEDAMVGEDRAKFNEERSPAWDINGLPSHVEIYHAKANDTVPLKEAESFRDSLAAAESRVQLEEVNGVGHDIEPFKHRLIIEKLVKNLQQP